MKKIFLIITVALLGTSSICAQNSEGTDFWVTFGKNSSKTSQEAFLELKIATGGKVTNVTLSFTEIGASTTITNIPAYSLRTIDLSNVPTLGDKRNSIYLDPSGSTSGTSNKALHITSTQPISVYAFNTSKATTDATIVMPIEAWGRDYYRLSSALYDNNHYDVELIIAREATTLTLPNGTTQNLSVGQVYYNSSASDMTGRHITSNKPVAYFTHTTSSAVPAGRTYGDILFEQMSPVDRWGKQFLVPNARQRGINFINGSEVDNEMNNIIRIVASENSTKINFSGATRRGGQNISSGGTINAGQYVELLLNSNTGACYIDADKPVGVCAYLVGAGVPNNAYYTGDPSIAWMPSLNQVVKDAVVAPFYPGTSANGGTTNLNEAASKHYAVIITKTATKAQTKINGTTVSSGWTDNSQSGYSHYVRQFNNADDINSVFKIENPNGIIVLCYGTSRVESYYYNAGSGACVIN